MAERRKPRRDPREWDEEYRALQATLEDYLREQVKLLSDDGAASAPAPSSMPEGWFRRWRAELYFVVTLALIALLWWRPAWLRRPAPPRVIPASSQGAEPPPAAPAAAAAADRTEIAAAPDPPEGFDDPDAWWRTYAESHRVELVPWLEAVSQARGLVHDQVSPMQKQNFTRWAGIAGSNAVLDAVFFNGTRTGLFEYVYGGWLQSSGGMPGGWGKVNLVIENGEYDPEALRRLLAEYGRDHWFESFDPKDKRLQNAVILCRLERRRP